MNQQPESKQDAGGQGVGWGCVACCLMLVCGVIDLVSGRVSARSLQLTGWPARLFGSAEIIASITLLWFCFRAYFRQNGGIVLHATLSTGAGKSEGAGNSVSETKEHK